MRSALRTATRGVLVAFALLGCGSGPDEASGGGHEGGGGVATSTNPCGYGAQPSAELCDGLDNDCDGLFDEEVELTYYRDLDGDGHGTPDSTATGCTMPAGYVASPSDCDDASASVHPDVAEVCNGVDDDCDGAVDQGHPGGGATCSTLQPGVCEAGTIVCSGGALGCQPDTPPSAEVCDGLDNDCNGVVDNGVLGPFDSCLAAWEPERAAAGVGLSNGNRTATNLAEGALGLMGSIGRSSGRWYWEVTVDERFPFIGVAAASWPLTYDEGPAALYYSNLGSIFPDSEPFGAPYFEDVVIGVALDADSLEVSFYRDGELQGSWPLAEDTWYPACVLQNGGFSIARVTANFGQEPFAYPVPSGYTAGLY